MKPTTLADFLRAGMEGQDRLDALLRRLRRAATPTTSGARRGPSNYVTKLSRQITGLIRCGEAERIATGEYLALVMDCTGQDALQWQEKGAPVGQMMPLDAAQQRYYYFAIPKNAQHPNAAKLYSVFQMTEEGQRLSYETWKTDLHFLPGSRMGKMVDGYLKQNVTFKEVTVEWSAAASRDQRRPSSELIKILTTKRIAMLVCTRARAASSPRSGDPCAMRRDVHGPRLRGNDRAARGRVGQRIARTA